MSDPILLQTRKLRKVYRRAARPAVDGLDLRVTRGQVFGFLGPNGAGKTTTIGMLLGNVFPTSGEGTLLGRPLGRPGGAAAGGLPARKFQFHEFLTATEFLDVHGRLYGMDAAARARRIPHVLELVGLGERAGAGCASSRRGMQQRAGWRRRSCTSRTW
jgi:ABC-2 type transport system ATP-binding protein